MRGFPTRSVRIKSLVLAGVLWATLYSSAGALPAGIVDEGAATRDTSTNLDWLDLSTTKGLSLPQVTTQYLSDGWHIASQVDVETFLGNAGVPNIFPSFNSPPDPELLQLQALLGLTFTSSQLANSYGWTSDFHPTLPGFRLVLLLTHDISTNTAGYSGGFFADPVNSGDVIVGWWLDRPHALPVPEPSSIALLLGGGVTMLALRRRAKRAN